MYIQIMFIHVGTYIFIKECANQLTKGKWACEVLFLKLLCAIIVIWNPPPPEMPSV